ncbi:MAG: redox-sensing transcriptional repressor Rex [Ruminococcaceae bacterium]|nr:redox-sensing transcriptional repressor Rex [Oscillospiraceae bacterium]
MPEKSISKAVINRLPRYHRYLGELIKSDITRISSGELAKRMSLTASQIRQDLNCFGGFGQQGYGYNVRLLYEAIGDILGVSQSYNAIIVGTGNLGHALATHPLFKNRGVNLIGLFDKKEDIIGQTVNGLNICHIDELEVFCAQNTVDIAVMTVPKTETPLMCEKLAKLGVKGFWNFSNMELKLPDYDVQIENMHMGDSLMKLCYKLTR